jgi:hypothetical protein
VSRFHVCLSSALSAALLVSSSAHAQVSASEVVSYTPSNENAFNNSASVLGLPSRFVPADPPFSPNPSDLTPFNPNFSSTHILRLPVGGSITLKLSSPIPSNSSRTLGVISNIGIADFSATGTGEASNPASSFSNFPVARVSVSSDGTTFVPLNGGALITFNMPAAGFTNTPAYDNYAPTGGTTPSDFSKPTPAAIQDGGFASFNGKTHAQIQSDLQGSGGGLWLSLGSSGLSSVQYVQFEVPTTAPGGSRFVLDAVVAVPEPGAIVLLGATAFALRRRR